MDVRFVRANGDQELKACSTKVFYGAVAPGATIDVSVKFSNPEKAGNYIALFRLSHGPQDNGIEFGDKAIADIQVKEQPKPKKVIEEYKPVNKEVQKAIERSEMMIDKFENIDKLEKSFELDNGDAQSVESNEI